MFSIAKLNPEATKYRSIPHLHVQCKRVDIRKSTLHLSRMKSASCTQAEERTRISHTSRTWPCTAACCHLRNIVLIM